VSNVIRVLICDDQETIRARIREALAKCPHIKVVGEAQNGQAAVSMALELKPDVVLMDLVMPDLNGIQATRKITAAAPGINVLPHSAGVERKTVDEMFGAGARGFLAKSGSSQELLRAIRSVAAGMYVCSPCFNGATASGRPPGEQEIKNPQEGSPLLRNQLDHFRWH
jgi:DNA-binding NarL/FixJ family response regulator